jgi:putative transposase
LRLPLSGNVLGLFLLLLPAAFFEELRRKQNIRQNARVYTAGVVLWLMIAQRLHSGGSMQTAVLELARGLPAPFWLKPCKRLTEDNTANVSGNTGAYNKARQKLPLSVVEQSFDHVFQQLTERAGGSLPALGRRAFLFDGTTGRTPHTEALRALYPPTSNQHGESHWPLIRVLVAHDLYTGLAMRAEWGPVNGPKAVSEQRLFDQAVEYVPEGSVVVGDGNFGVFSVAYAADVRNHPVVLRLTLVRARSLLCGPLTDGIDRRIEWRPTKADRESHPDLPADAHVRGRLIVSEVQPSNGNAAFLLCLFTTLLDEDQKEILDLYGKRWNIETDLRSLKCTLRLDELTCTTPEMVAKEIHLGLMAYNLVRAVIYTAAEKAGVAPRSYAFTRVKNIVAAFAPLIAAAKTEEEAEKITDRMMYYVGQARQSKRKRKSYPREVWHRSKPFPKRKV